MTTEAAITTEDLAASQELLDFIARSPSMFHTIATERNYLDQAGFAYLPEGATWQMRTGGRYYTTRNGSSLIAWTVGTEALSDPACVHFQMAAAHSDSPTYKVKAMPELEGPGGYLRLDVEAYGGMIDSSWFDRPLGLAGRVLVRDDAPTKNDAAPASTTSALDAATPAPAAAPATPAPIHLTSHLYAPQRDLLLIPNVAIHFNRKVNDGYDYNRQVDLCPLFSAGALQKGAFDALVADELGVQPSQILGKDLFLVNRQQGRVWGAAQEFVSTSKLDDLQCAFVALKAFLAAQNPASINVYCCFDNEEVGSNTKQGALSTFLHDTLVRLSLALGLDQDGYLQALSRSFMVSCDNAHAVHPNHPQKSDEVNRTYLNQGIVIKEAANQKYTTDAFGRAVFAALCQRAGVPTQSFANRSDMAGGSTLGNLSNMQVSVHALDIGLPQLAMHSAYETAGTKDTLYGIRGLTAFYQANLAIDGADGVGL